ncbi:S1C family serine protease [Bacillus timonensis]|nr:S1C family serine protease [Bacillus timonensis]
MNVKWFLSISLYLSLVITGLLVLFFLNNPFVNALDKPPQNLIENTKKENNLQNQKKMDIKSIIERTQKTVVMIELDDGSIGSGFLYNEKGDIITNAHVVSGHSYVKIRTSKSKGYSGRVIGISDEIDIAVIRVEGLKDVSPADLVEYDLSEVGDEVIALGSPLGFQNTVTVGIISGIGREFDIPPYNYEDVYQISAPISQGNSGGPLIDKRSGKVIGINSAVIEDGTIGFSIPVVQVLSIVKEWSNNPIVSLDEGSVISKKLDPSKVEILEETALYNIASYFNWINNKRFSDAYSLMGIQWKEQLPFEDFKKMYENARSLTVDEMVLENRNDYSVSINCYLTIEKQIKNQVIEDTYLVKFEFGYENGEPKILSGSFHAAP